ncbi:MAG: dihydrodipicolinate synthase family protein, partial [Ginsengibacter sp.]
AANCFPQDFSEMIRLSLNFHFSEAQQIQYKLLDALDLLFVENNPAGVKAFLHAMNLIENEVRLPVVPLSEQFYKKVAAFVAASK